MVTNGRRPTISRSAVFAGSLVLASVAAHSAAAGSLPGLPALLAAVTVATGLSLGLGSKRRSLPWLIVFLFAGQMLLHVAVVAVGHHATSMLPGPSMLLAHLVVAFGFAIAISHGEAVVAVWMRAASYMLGVTDLTVRALATRQLTVQWRRTPVETPVVIGSSVSRRGPPVQTRAFTFA